MAKKKNFDDVTSQLAVQAKERFSPVNEIADSSASNDTPVVPVSNIAPNKKEPKKQKTVYLTPLLLKRLKKASYIKDLDQSEIVAIALEQYLENEEIYLEDKEM